MACYSLAGMRRSTAASRCSAPRAIPATIPLTGWMWTRYCPRLRRLNHRRNNHVTHFCLSRYITGDAHTCAHGGKHGKKESIVEKEVRLGSFEIGRTRNEGL